MKERLDILVADKLGLTRSKAQALIMSGSVLIDDKPATKSGTEYQSDVEIRLKDTLPYVSRGALKLEKAATEFGLDFAGKIICDIGASTGGFTDYVLQQGAKKVYAIDCGYGQLDQKLRKDKRVINMERTNIKEVDSLPEPIDVFVIDVSFISLKQVLPQVTTIIRNSKLEIINSSDLIALVKPQFEVGKEIADKYRGVIKDQALREKVLDNIIDYSTKLGFKILGKTESPITGAKGNLEYLVLFNLELKT
jgi:23S rRNA (cytidine1920-2'-O)/16S rRNA (cytidine1409-2'-O)-methyltransferase